MMAWVKLTLKYMNQTPHPTWKKRCFRPGREPKIVGEKARNPSDMMANARQAMILRFEGECTRGHRSRAPSRRSHPG